MRQAAPSSLADLHLINMSRHLLCTHTAQLMIGTAQGRHSSTEDSVPFDWFSILLSLSFSLSHTHTHTHKTHPNPIRALQLLAATRRTFNRSSESFFLPLCLMFTRYLNGLLIYLLKKWMNNYFWIKNITLSSATCYFNVSCSFWRTCFESLSLYTLVH